jgi:hypothetical protein
MEYTGYCGKQTLTLFPLVEKCQNRQGLRMISRPILHIVISRLDGARRRAWERKQVVDGSDAFLCVRANYLFIRGTLGTSRGSFPTPGSVPSRDDTLTTPQNTSV